MAIKIMSRDLIAGLMIICGTILKLGGYDGIVDMFLIGIAGFYFGAELLRPTTRPS